MLFNLHMMYLILLKLAGGLEYIFITCITTAALHLSNTSPRFDNGAYSICKLIVVYCCTLFHYNLSDLQNIPRDGWDSGAVVSTVVSQREGPGCESLGQLESACSPYVCFLGLLG